MKIFDKGRGQAALEFLTTYGWAFLVILVMIAALSYFGVLDASRFVPDSCKLDGNVECPSFALTYDDGVTDGIVQLEIQSNVGDAVDISRIRIKEKEAAAWCETSSVVGVPALPIAARASADVTFTFDGADDLDFATCGVNEDGDKKSYDLEIYYTKGASTIENLAAGAMTTTARAP